MTLFKDGTVTLIQNHSYQYRNHSDGILQCGSEIRLNSKYKMGKRGSLAKELGGGAINGKLLRGHIMCKREFWVNLPDRLLLKAGRVIRPPLEDPEDKELDETWRVESSLLTRLSRILPKTGFYKEVYGWD